jgi:prevent-host-death family protein
MALIGVRELREQASEVIRRVRKEHAEFVITYQGRPVAMLLPLDTEKAEAEMVRAGRRAVLGLWEQYDELVAAIRKAWPEGLAQDVIDSLRR